MLLNILSNAIKFTPANGHITISVKDDDHQDYCSKNTVKFEIEDDGVGIPVEDQKRLFQVSGIATLKTDTWVNNLTQLLPVY